MELTTPRLVLREFRLDDFATTHAYGADVEVTRHMIFGPNSEDETRAFLERTVTGQALLPRISYDLAVVLKDRDVHVGSVALHMAGEQAELGYVFGKAVWGQGFATEAARALVSYGFRELHLHRVFARCDVQNPASARVMAKLGMRHEGTFLGSCKVKGAWRDELRYAILAKEWTS